MYDRSVDGMSRQDAPPWLALPDDDRAAWLDMARFAVDAADDLREEDAADDALDLEGQMREDLETRYRAQIDHWRRMTERLERQRDEAVERAAAQVAELTAQLQAATAGADT
jgi:hypothetical protein